MKLIEKVQRRLTKCVPGLKDMKYQERLKVNESYPLLPLGGVLKQDFKHSFNLNLTHRFFSSAKHKGESRSKTIG